MSLRTLVVTTFFPNASDRSRAVFVENLVRALQRHRAVDVISPVPYALPIRRIARWHELFLIPDYESINGIDVLHPRFLVLPKLNWFSGFGYFLGIAFLLRRFKRVYGTCLVHAHCAYPDGVGVALASRTLGLPYVVTTHGSDINVYASHATLRPQISWALRNADGVIAVSDKLKQKVEKLTGGIQRNIACIPCAGFDPDVFFPRNRGASRTQLEISENSQIVIFVGQLVPIKGVEFLIDAWAKLHQEKKLGDNDRLIVIGDGNCRADLEQQSATAGVGSSVKFTGTLTQTEISHWVAAANLLCLPSHNEGTPNVIVESLASGIPVVATRVGGVPDLIQENENGLLVAPAHAAELADALTTALSREWDAKIIQQSVAHLTWQAIAARNNEFLDSIPLR